VIWSRHQAGKAARNSRTGEHCGGSPVIAAAQGNGLTRYAIGQTVGTDQVPTQPVQVNTGSGPSTIVNSVAAASGNNLQPVLGLTYIICVEGIFPSQTS
jgi:microcystin-dependent protein